MGTEVIAAARDAQVKLGDHTYNLVPQRHAYLQRRLGALMEQLSGIEDIAGAAILDSLGDQLYQFMRIFIPDLMPEWEYKGYGIEEAMEADEYVEINDHSPAWADEVAAIEVALRVNRLDLIKHVAKLIDQLGMRDFIRAQLKIAIGDFTAQRLPAPKEDDPPPKPPGSSLSSSSQNGAETQTTSGPKSPTSESSEGGPSPASTASSTAT
jgi:hypothetical protein